MSEQAGTVATEALIVSIAQRHLQSRYQKVHVTRGDGNVVFTFSALDSQAAIADAVEKLCMAFTKELTGRSTLHHGVFGEMNFHVLKNESVSFVKFMEEGNSSMPIPDLAQLPRHEGVTKMLNVLYADAVAEAGAKGAIAVREFPAHMCPDGFRFDVAAAKNVLIKGFSKTDESLIPQEDRVEQSADALLDASVKKAESVGIFDLLGASAKAKILIESRLLGELLAPFSTAPVESFLPQQWRIRAFSLDEAVEVLRVVYDKLVEFWKTQTHTEKNRVNAISLLGIVSGDCKEFCREQILLESSDLVGPWRMSRSVIEKALALCRQWREYCQRLTHGVWEDWDGGSFYDEAFDNFVERLKSTVRIRTLVENANSLLQRPDVLYDVQPEYLFEGLSLTDSKETTMEQWAAAVKKFETNFAILDSSLIGKLRGLLQAHKDEELVRVAKEFINILRRDAVHKALDEEMRMIAQHFQGRISRAVSRFEQQRASASNAITASLRAARCLQTEVLPLVEEAKGVLHHTPYITAIEEQASKAAIDAVNLERSLLEKWKGAVEERAAGITEAKGIVVIAPVPHSEQGFIAVRLDPAIESLRHEVAQVTSMVAATAAAANVDLKFNALTQRTLETCARIAVSAMRLMQLAAGFNATLQQMLPSTRTMLEPTVRRCRDALLPANAVAPTGERAIGFVNAGEVESLAARFFTAVEAMSLDNRKIRRAHCELITTVLGLYNIDLLRNPDQWKNVLKDLRAKFDQFERSINAGKTDEWRRHWDYQLYKVLEHQYCKGLEQLNENVHDFKVDLVFKSGNVQFKPGFEALREAYYAKIRDFINIPQRFKGVANSEFFALMPARNSAAIAQVHEKAMELFNKLNKVRKQFRDFVVVGVCGTNGAPDLDLIVESMVDSIPQWEAGYKLVKERLRKMNMIEEHIVIDCVDISTAPIKASIEDHLHKLEDALTTSLRKAMQKILNDIDDFVLAASNIIERQPTTLEEVGKANRAYHDFKDQLPKYEKGIAELDAMNALLRAHSGAPMEMSLTRSRWDHLMDAMASHHRQIDASVAKMRVNVDGLIQKYLKELQRFAEKWNSHKPVNVAAFKTRQEFIEKGLNYVKEQALEFEEHDRKGTELVENCEAFKIYPPDMTLRDETKKDVAMHLSMWREYETFEETLDVLRKEDWLTFRSHIYQFEDFIKEWRDKIRAATEAQGGAATLVHKYLSGLLDEYNVVLPMLKFVRGEGMLPEHWGEMFRLLEIEKGMTSDKLTFGDILAHHAQLLAKEKEIKGLHARAQGEVQIRDALQDLRTWALDAAFTLIMPQDSTSKVKLISEWKDVMTQVSDNQALVASLKDSPFFPRFADEANGWEQKLVLVNEYLLLLNSIQRKWTYLEPLFARGALPNEQPRFKRVDKEFVGILREVEADPRIMSLAQHPDYSEKLKSILEQIERCQKALNEFLEQKRNKFPRFYFISDEDLLEILGQSKNPTVIQSHLKKLFMGINTVAFDESKTAIVRMISSDGEQVPLAQTVAITDNNVEEWLIRLDDVMRVTLRQLLKACCAKGTATAMAVIEQFPSQLLQVAEQIFFARDVESAIPSGNFTAVLQKYRTKLDELTGLDTRNDAVLELKTKALILDIIHNIEVIELLAQENVRDVMSWWWQKQLRYYLDETEGCLLRMVDTVFRYTFEYQGNAPKLVHTPLTDKCYLTLTKGMHLGYGGNPYGPAGTGKTESVKALGSAMGRQVLVFNCDEGIDFKAMGRIFIGIVKCGAWGCFDEFNRLKVDQLSAISQMIQVIQEALKNGEPECHLLGRAVEVNPNSGIFVTLNPAGKGYGGRSKLPDNLKQLFRAVAMSAPDNELITATMLLSEGFRHARELSKKVVEVYKLSKQLLSQQQHYDWGLRPLKAVLRLGGTLVQQHRRANPGVPASEEQEAQLMVQSLRINTLSKLTFDDARLFNGLISDIFPRVPIKEISYAELEAAIRSSIEALGLQVIDSQIHKVLQLYEAMNQRMGVVLVGPSGSGKSTLLKILRKALQTLRIEVPWHVMNPKAMPRNQLLGHMDIDTREWFDGVLSAAARKVVKEPAEVRCWIFCDGDIDPEWVESLNSVLDDNKLLTMPNGVRIQFGNNINFVFETHSLQYASPATVSRMGIIFLSEEDVQPQAVVQSLMAHVSDEGGRREKLQAWMDRFLYQAVELAEKSDALVVEDTRMGLLNAALTHVMWANPDSNLDLCVALIRGLGSSLRADEQKKFARKIFEMTGERPLDTQNPLNTYFDGERQAPAEFRTDRNNAMTFEDLQSGNTVVRVAETERIFKVLEPLVQSDDCKPFFLVGPTGCGKSKVLNACFAAAKGVRVSVIHCSAQTSAQHLIQKMQQLCSIFSTNAGKVLRPKEGDRLVLCLKDINLPKPDKYGTVQLHSFLQQLLLYRGFYDSDLEWVGVERVQIVGSMNPVVSPGRFPVAPRLLAIVNIVSMSYPSSDSMQIIYANYFNALVSSPQLRDTGRDGQELARFATTVFDRIKKRFEGEEYAHCVYCPRDVTLWVTNVMRYNLEGGDLLAILLNEGQRIFCDRLHRNEDRAKANQIIAEAIATIGYASNKDEAKPSLYVSWPGEWLPTGFRPFTLVNYEQVKKDIKDAMVKYGREFKELNISLTPDTIKWITKIDRALSQPCGHVLLVGRAGVGRRAALTIASYLLRIEVVVLNMTRDYSLKSFRADLRTLYQRAGVQNERLTLLVEDHNLVSESFLEMLNSLISSGEVPGLFTPEELEPMLGPLREEASNEGWLGTIYQYFVLRVNRNLRVALIMDYKNERFGPRCQANPALLTKCTLLWMGVWSSDGIKYICKTVLRDVIEELEKSEVHRDLRLASEMIQIHQSQGEKATPQQFLTLMAMYQQIYQTKGKSSNDALARLEMGLEKLREAEHQVATIEREVGEKKIQMEKKQEEADAAMTQITNNMAEAAEQRTAAEELSQKLDQEQKDISVKSARVTEELSTIQPTLDAAKEAVGGIKSENLSEIRALKTPPEPIRDVLEGVLGLLGVTDTSWAGMRKFLGERGVKERILDFDTHSVTPAIREQVNKLLTQKANSFRQEIIARASVAAAPLAAWVKANVDYATVLERVGPLQNQLNELQENKRKGEERLQKTQKKLKKIDENVEQLRKDFANMCKEAERLKDKLEKAQRQLDLAHELLEKLSGEKVRWSEDAVRIKEENKLMPRTALISAAFVTYLASEPEDVRSKFVRMWAERLRFETPPKVTAFMRKESEILQYKAEGLPSDGLSQENAIVILDSIQTPLIVDPASQALEWLKAHLKSKDVTCEVSSMHDERFAHTLELAIRFGKTLLVNEIDRVDPMLFPVLRRDLVSQGPKKVVQLGNKTVDWQENFRIFLLTRSTDLVLPPDSAALVAEVNFSITRSGLESQLLGITIQHEKPELEQQKVELLQREEALKVQLSQLEESLLADLANSHGNLVENVGLISSLNEIKTQASTIQQALAQSKDLAVELDQKREVYRPFAAKGSVMFFLIKDMECLSRMYQFSLSDFLGIFQGTLSTYNGSNDDIDAKIAHLSLQMAQRSFLHVSRGLFKKDRIEFAMHVVHHYYPEAFPQHLWDVFIGATAVADTTALQLPQWANPTASAGLAAAQSVAPDMVARWNLHDPFWAAWAREETPEKSLERAGNGSFPYIERLLLVGIFRRDRLMAAMTAVFLETMRLDTLVEVNTIDTLVAEASCFTPILLVTSAGADPSIEVQEVAYRTVGRARFTQIALGGGQTDEAMNQLRRCASEGEWIFLKNLHLVLDWVAVLEKEVSAMTTVRPHENFRLFLTTEAHDQFPSGLLKSSLKVTFESPPGVKQNLMRSYGNWTPEFLAQLPPLQSQLLFGLAWFHAILQERRTYIPQGWVKFYEFTQADQKAASDVILAMSATGNVDWTTVQGMLESAVYGGRLDNDQDVKVLQAFIRKVFNPATLVQTRVPLFESLCVPATNNHAQILEAVRTVPDTDPPTIFSLPTNADRVVGETEAAQHLGNLRTIANLQSAAASGSSDALRALLPPVLEKWRTADVKLQGPPAALSAQGDPDPLEVFFVSEINLLRRIITNLTAFFEDMKMVGDGILLPTAQFRSVAQTLIAGGVPEDWQDQMTGPSVLVAWLGLLNRKHNAMLKLFGDFRSDPSGIFRAKLRMTEMLRPHTFLNALRQYTARRTGEPLVNLVLAAFTSPSMANGQVPVTLDGSTLLIQGAAPAGGGLQPVDLNAPSAAPFVDVTVAWVKSAGLANNGFAKIPVYSNSTRELHIFDLRVPCRDEDRDTWVTAGAACFLAE